MAEQTTQSTSVAPAAPPFTSSLNAHTTNASALPSASLPSQTTTEIASTSNAVASRSFAPIPSSAPAGANANASDYSHSLTPTVAATSNAPPPPPYSHRLNTRTVVGIVLGALSLFLVIALALFLLFRRRIQRRGKRMSTESSWRRLKAHPFDDGSSGFISSVWTGFGSVSVDPDVDPRRDTRRHSLGLRFAEKEKDANPECLALGTCTSGPSPPPAGTQPLARRASSVRSLQEGQVRVPHLNDIILSSSGLGESSNSELLVLAGTDYHVANVSKRGDSGLEGGGSEASHMTTTSGNVQSMEAL